MEQTRNNRSAALALGLDQHGATLPTTSSLVSAICQLRADLTDARHRLVLVAASLANAGEVADVHGAHALEVVTAEVARRTLQHAGVPTRLLRASPLGGFLAAVVVERGREAAQVEALLADVRRLVDLPTDRVWPVVTTGAALCDDTDDASSVIRDVRAAVVAAGREAPGATRWHRGGSHPGVPDDELARTRDLAVALVEDPDQLHLHYQPVHDLGTGTLVGAEALLRWEHPTRGAVSPLLTVQAAERTGLIVPLGRHVLARALAQVAGWTRQVRPDFRLHVNVSPIELREPSYVDHVASLLELFHVAPANLLLEITETALITDEPVVRSTLLALRSLGVGLGIDDFGTGYSSISHLGRLPVEVVKVDRSLVAGIGRDAGDFRLARAVLELVSTLGVTIVAEGIESAVEAAHLRAMGCTYGQGYHLGRPVPPEQLLTGGRVAARHAGPSRFGRAATRGARAASA